MAFPFSKAIVFLCVCGFQATINALQTGSNSVPIMQRRAGAMSSLLGRRTVSLRNSKLYSSLIVDEPLKLALQTPHPYRNITPVILEKVGKNLHRNDKHPLGIIKSKIEEYCNQYTVEKGQTKFEIFDNLSPLVNTKNCFDDLRVGPDHPSRRQSDTYYVTGTKQHSKQICRCIF